MENEDTIKKRAFFNALFYLIPFLDFFFNLSLISVFFREDFCCNQEGKDYNHTKKTIHHPFPEGKEIPEEYKWIKKIVSEENWAVTYQKAYEMIPRGNDYER